MSDRPAFDPTRPWPADRAPPPADVVVVADFRSGRSESFAPRTLLFLAMWMEHAGAAREWPLHLVGIGEPPEVVRSLAARAGARVSVTAPWPYEGRGTLNKLRGLQLPGDTDRILLLDADVYALDDPSSITTLGDGLALAPCIVPRVPQAQWQQLFEALGVPLPTARIPCIQAEVGGPPTHKLLYEDQLRDMPAMLPYYNAGVILAPRDCGLLAGWERFVLDARDALGEDRWLKVVDGDQTALVPAVELLRARGLALARLPWALHASDAMLYSGACSVRELKLFHAFGLFRRMSARGLDIERGWRAWRRRLLLVYRENGWRHPQDDGDPGDDPVEVQLRKLWRRLRRPWRRHVEPLLAPAGSPDGHGHAADA